MVRLRLVFFGALLGGGAISPSAMAQDDPVAPFRECGGLAGAEARLACFDSALKASDADASARSARRSRRAREDFGLSAPQIAERERMSDAPAAAADDAEPDRIESVLQAVFTDGRGKNVFLLANGQVWRETNASTYRGIIREGWTAEVRKGGIGGFRLSFKDRTGMFAVERLR